MKADYLDLEVIAGVTKHLGGIPASRRLLEACHVAEAQEVLDVGCGVGIEAVRIARATSARVVGLDVFAGDNEPAIRELVRVTRPGGWVGLNEACHLASAPSRRVSSLVTSVAPADLPTELSDRRTIPGRSAISVVATSAISWEASLAPETVRPARDRAQ